MIIASCLDSMEKLPKLVEDIIQTSINTGPRGALRLVQGIQAVVGVGGEWLTDLSKVHVLHLNRSILLVVFDAKQLGTQNMLFMIELCR